MELGLTVILTEPPPLPHVPYTGTDRHPWLGKMREETFADWLSIGRAAFPKVMLKCALKEKHRR
jgi:hypothetical protein